MRPSIAFEKHREDIRRIVAANRGGNPRVFGSVARGEDTDESDLDILIDLAGQLTLFDMARMSLAIEKLVHTKVDILTPNSLPPQHRAKILAEAKPV